MFAERVSERRRLSAPDGAGSAFGTGEFRKVADDELTEQIMTDGRNYLALVDDTIGRHKGLSLGPDIKPGFLYYSAVQTELDEIIETEFRAAGGDADALDTYVAEMLRRMTASADLIGTATEQGQLPQPELRAAEGGYSHRIVCVLFSPLNDKLQAKTRRRINTSLDEIGKSHLRLFDLVSERMATQKIPPQS